MYVSKQFLLQSRMCACVSVCQCWTFTNIYASFDAPSLAFAVGFSLSLSLSPSLSFSLTLYISLLSLSLSLSRSLSLVVKQYSLFLAVERLKKSSFIRMIPGWFLFDLNVSSQYVKFVSLGESSPSSDACKFHKYSLKKFRWFSLCFSLIIRSGAPLITELFPRSVPS